MGSLSESSKVWILAVCGLVFAQIVASFLLRRTFELSVLSDVTQCVLLLSGTAALLPCALRNRGRTRVFWLLMSLGVAMWLSYQLLWTYIEVILRQDVPDPFVGDIILFLHLVPMMAALALRPHAELDDRTTRLGTLDFALLLMLWVYLYLYSVIPWQYAFTDELTYSHSFNFLYLTEKAVLLAGLALLWHRSRGTWKIIYAHLFGATFMYALSSYIANWAIAKQLYYTGSVYDVPLAVSMAWVTLVGVLAQETKPKAEPSRFGATHGVWISRLGMGAILLLPLFAIWALLDVATPPQVRIFRIMVTLATVMIMGGMVFIRQHLLDWELVRLLRVSQDSYENLKALQAQLVQSEKMASLGQLVGGAAHELNNPLTAMLGYSDLLIATDLPPAERTAAEKLGQQVRRTKALVSSLLSFARQVPIDKTPLNLNTVAITAIKLSEPQLKARKIETKLDLAPDLPQILGNSNQLLQVCLQIINSAIFALDEVGGGLLAIKSWVHDGIVSLEFSDNGWGSRELDQAFSLDPNVQVGARSGIGLSASYGIIQEHNGRILQHTKSERGGIFRIEIPTLNTDAKNSARNANGPSPEYSALLPITPKP